MDLGSRKSLDDHHAAATFGTEPKWARFLGRGGFGFGLRWLYCSEQLKAKRQEGGASAVGKVGGVDPGPLHCSANVARGVRTKSQRAEWGV